jgi:2-oxoglutarate dehydrogenase E2 component (dihydrolipoamide succinyltransferase)
MPQLGESVSEGTVVRWLKRVGETIAVDEPLFEVATDKVNTEIPSLEAGVVQEILVPDGATVPVGTILARIEAVGAATSARASSNGAASSLRVAQAKSGRSGSQLHSPVVRRLAREHGVDIAKVAGSGRNGRVTRADMLAHAASGARAGEGVSTMPSYEAPARIIPPPNGSRNVPFSPMRARIAENVFAAKRQVADVFSVMEVDMENVHAARLAQRDAHKQRTGASLTYLPFIARATIEALRAFPAVNARIDGNALAYADAVHLGMAVDLEETGLVVPVIRDADGLNLTGLARAIADASSSARAGSLAAADYAGSTFTITNNGAFGTLMTAPIINHPNVAILSTDAIEDRVVPHHGMIAIRKRMYLCMSWDHRAFDGSTAARFLARIKRDLEERDWSAQF